jgi:hypothetical protein
MVATISIVCNVGDGGNYGKQDRQSTHNVTLRRVHETTVAIEKQ